MPAAWSGAPRLRVHEQRVRREHEDAVLGEGEREPSGHAVRRDEESERADGALDSHLFGIPTTGLRFFTVYGPWGRPDMALFLFAKAILEGRPIQVFNEGRMRRDFTYVDDIVEGIVRVADRPATSDPGWRGDAPNPSMSAAPWRLFNIGNSHLTELLRYIEVLEDCLGRKAEQELLPMQLGDVPARWADVDALAEAVGYRPATTVEVGVKRLGEWYREDYGV
jgi:UDP-glucuronate 4-epimerase